MAFPALALFDLLREPMSMLPAGINAGINTLIAQKRLQEFLEARSWAPRSACYPGFM